MSGEASERKEENTIRRKVVAEEKNVMKGEIRVCQETSKGERAIQRGKQNQREEEKGKDCI